MYWTELKSALLYDQPHVTVEMMQPQTAQIAVKEIARLVNFGWIDELPEDTLDRIKMACNVGECPEIWDELRHWKHTSQRKRRKKRRKKATAVAS